MFPLPRQVALAVACVCLAASAPADAGSPGLRLGKNVRLLVAGDVFASFAPRDEGFFNYSDYSSSTLRLFQAALSLELRTNTPLSLLTRVRSDNLGRPVVHALYLRFHPWRERKLDLQVGRIPPVFGLFSRRGYGSGDPLIGRPLAYQYLTTVRPDAVPLSADELLAQRGHGWRPLYYTREGTTAEPGLPLVHGIDWDTGVQLRAGVEPFELAVALTRGTLGNPLVREDNGGKQVAARLVWEPVFGFELGLSAARGRYLEREVASALPDWPGLRAARQQALGADLEYARGHLQVLAELIRSTWEMPTVDPVRPLAAVAWTLEARYALGPGWYTAARVDRLDFSETEGALDRLEWDAPVWRVEAGMGLALHRQVRLKASYQHNWRDGGPLRTHGSVAGQIWLRF